MKPLFLLILLSPFFAIAQPPNSQGSVSNGKLIVSKKFQRKGSNYRFFSPTSYFLLRRGFVNPTVEKVVREAYHTCKTTCPGKTFRIMEASRKRGGKMWPHRTHQNGLSVDFMTPLKRGNKQFRLWDELGILHYLLGFNSKGKLKGSKKVEIDYETMARHILALDDAARAHGMKITKVIFKIELQKEFFKTPSGKKVKRRGIYFVRGLPRIIDNLHDDHYHVDFGWR
jgi:penicillin-insensitive murein endopeptidase